MRLKQALGWPAIEVVMIKHWEKHQWDRGLMWPTESYRPLLVLMWVKDYTRHIKQDQILDVAL